MPPERTHDRAQTVSHCNNKHEQPQHHRLEFLRINIAKLLQKYFVVEFKEIVI